MENINLDLSPIKLNLSLDEYDTLVESIAKANALTKILLAHTTDSLGTIVPDDLYNFLWALQDLLHEANNLCRTVKPEGCMQ